MKTAAEATLIDVLRQRAADQTDVRGYTFLNNGTAGNDELTYGELDRREPGNRRPTANVLWLWGSACCSCTIRG